MSVISERKSSAAEERQIVGTRLYDAPRELVWKMFTEAEHVAKWWGPRGFRTSVDEMDLRPGGVWNFVMHGPDGTDYRNKCIYREVAVPERLAWSHVSGPLFEAEVRFDAEGEKTRVTMTMTFDSAELRDRVADEYGAVEGLAQTLGNLSEELARVRGPLVISRTFDAPRELVWSAWTDAQHLAKWWGPKHFDNPVCEVDVRPGGAIRIDMRGPDGVVYPMGGWYNEIVAPERLVFTTTALEDANGKPQLENLNIVIFTAHDEQTTIDLRVYTVVASEAAAFALSGMREGWTGSVDKLDDITRGTREYRFVRELDAPRELVWHAWTNAEDLKKWFGTKDMPIETMNVDLRAGGTVHYAMHLPDGRLFWLKWRILEVEVPSRLSVLVMFSNENGDAVRHPMQPAWPLLKLSVLTFDDLGGRTRVTMRSYAYDATEEERKAFEAGFEGMTGGWIGSFARLEEFVATT